jgi:Fe-S cluster biogenesis protein NfuA
MADETIQGATPEAAPSDAQFAAQVQAILDKIRVFLQADGGDIELVGIEGRDVKVRLQGACKGCPGAAYTLKMGVEAALRREIPSLGNLIPVD